MFWAGFGLGGACGLLVGCGVILLAGWRVARVLSDSVAATSSAIRFPQPPQVVFTPQASVNEQAFSDASDVQEREPSWMTWDLDEESVGGG